MSLYGMGAVGWSGKRCGRTSDCVPCVTSSDVTRASYWAGQVPLTVTCAVRAGKPGALAVTVSVVGGTGRPLDGAVTTRFEAWAPAPFGKVICGGSKLPPSPFASPSTPSHTAPPKPKSRLTDT